ncbi:hypothetical protein CQW23_22616 [Capsicum baccatum]|uniref:Uncharacterized protein n=1 Tax=Capsicum baccatum TaxID=33114 RepID=A0A2G2W1G7_CAPBA|nr:hypothetical protein CQW23_22616 [Capsicum baccatum]
MTGPVWDVAFLQEAVNELRMQHFFLAGNPHPKGLSGSRYEEEIESLKEQESDNFVPGYDPNLLAEVFNVDREVRGPRRSKGPNCSGREVPCFEPGIRTRKNKSNPIGPEEKDHGPMGSSKLFAP